MTFIPKNPLSIPKIEKSPPSPPLGTRGLFAKEDGWYDINDNGETQKLASNIQYTQLKEGADIDTLEQGNYFVSWHSNAEGKYPFTGTGILIQFNSITKFQIAMYDGGDGTFFMRRYVADYERWTGWYKNESHSHPNKDVLDNITGYIQEATVKKGTLSDVDIRTVSEAGIYKVENDCTGMPTEINNRATFGMTLIVMPRDSKSTDLYYNQYLFVNGYGTDEVNSLFVNQIFSQNGSVTEKLKWTKIASSDLQSQLDEVKIANTELSDKIEETVVSLGDISKIPGDTETIIDALIQNDVAHEMIVTEYMALGETVSENEALLKTIIEENDVAHEMMVTEYMALGETLADKVDKEALVRESADISNKLKNLADYELSYDTNSDGYTIFYAQRKPDNIPLGMYIFAPEQKVDRIILVSADDEIEFASYQGKFLPENTYIIDFRAEGSKLIYTFNMTADQSVLDEVIAYIGDMENMDTGSATNLVDYINEVYGRVASLETELYDSQEGIFENSNKIEALTGENGRITIAEGEIDALQETIKGLSGSMHFKGVKDAVPTDVTGYKAGDTIIVGNKEFVFDGTTFKEFGDTSVDMDVITTLTDRIEVLEEAEKKYMPLSGGTFSGDIITPSVTAEELKDTYVSLHSEDDSSNILPFLFNDISFLLEKGGSVEVYTTTDTDYTIPALTHVKDNVSYKYKLFNSKPDYYYVTLDSLEDVTIIDLALHKTFTWNTRFYIDFGGNRYGFGNVKIYSMNTAIDNTTYSLKKTLSKTGSIVNHYNTVFNDSNKGFNALRIVLSNPKTVTNRIAEIGLIAFDSSGLANTVISVGGNSSIIGDLAPYNTEKINLGSTAKKWNNIYAKEVNATTFTGNLTGTASSAKADGNGNNIIDTYATKKELIEHVGVAGADGVGISKIEKTSTSGNVDTYTITLTNGTTTTFTVTNGTDGEDGEDGVNGTNGKDGVSATHSWDGTTLTVTSASGTSSANLKGEKGDTGTIPLFANSISECTDTSKLYVLPNGDIYAYMSGEHEVTTEVLAYIKEGQNTRIKSDGTFTVWSTTPSDISGYIPVKPGDVIRLENMTVPDEFGEQGNYSNGFCCYNESKTIISGAGDGTGRVGLYYIADGSLDALNRVVEDGNVTQFTIAPSICTENVAYIVLNVADINDKSKVYVTGTRVGDGWTKIGVAFASADYEDRIVDLEEETANHETRLKQLETNGEGNSSDIPEYWLKELKTKADIIQQAMETAGRNKSAFLWYTDAHWEPANSKMSPKLLNYLYKNTSMNKVNFGGDIVADPLSFTHDNIKYVYEWRKAIKGLPNHHSVLGNHDGHIYGASDDIIYSLLLAPEETPDMVMGKGLYYYIDNPCERTRYLYLDSGKYSLSDNETKFIIDTLTDTPNDWHIVVISHIWFEYNAVATPTVGNINPSMQKALNLFDAYNARQSGSITMKSVANSYDFKSCGGKVEFCIGGHIHVDHEVRSNDGIPVIITASDQNYDRSPNETEDFGDYGTSKESAVFGIIADYDNNKITVVGVGRGTSRDVAIVQEAVKAVSILNINYSGDTTVGATIDKSKFTFTVTYSNGTTNTVTGTTSVNPTTISAAGNNSVTISYTEEGTTVTGTATIVGTQVDNVPTSISNVTYSGDTAIGSTIDKSKFSFKVNYSNGSTSNKTGATTVSPTSIATVGNNSVKVNYTENGATVSATVTIVGTEAAVTRLFNLNRDYVSGTAGANYAAALDERNAYLNASNSATTFADGVKCTVTNITEDGVTVTESGNGGICVAYPIHLSDIGTQSYRLTFDYSGAGKLRSYYRYATTSGTVSTQSDLYTNNTAGASGSADVTIPASEGYEWLIILFTSNTGSIKTFTNVSLTKV